MTLSAPTTSSDRYARSVATWRSWGASLSSWWSLMWFSVLVVGHVEVWVFVAIAVVVSGIEAAWDRQRERRAEVERHEGDEAG